MSRTVTALYDSRAEAESAKQRLEGSVDADSVKIIDQNSHGDDAERGSWLSNMFGSHDDRHTFDEGLRRGSFLLCAQVDSDEDEDRIVRLLEQTGSVDIDQRNSEWRSQGWQPQAQSQGTAQAGSFGQSGTATGNATQEEHIPIVEEQLRVGKRTVSRGGAHVRSYIEEVPVEESVSLREEHVSIERRPVDKQLGAAELKDGDLFRDRDIEMTETAEEAVVGKEARVKEELVVSKSATERTEQIHDTVRHTEVEVDDNNAGRTDAGNNPDRGAFGFDKNR